MVFQVIKRVGFKLFKIKLVQLCLMTNSKNFNRSMIGRYLSLRKLCTSENFSTNIMEDLKKPNLITGFLSGVEMLLTHLLEF